MNFLKDLVKENGHKIVRYNEAKENYKYMTIFNYSIKYGKTFDGFKYYNDYSIEIGKEEKLETGGK